MLLPSAISCSERNAIFQKPARPKLVSSTSYRPAWPVPTQNATTSVLVSCRALQAILGHAPPPAPASPTSTLAPAQRISQPRVQSALRNEWRNDSDAETSTSPLDRAHSPSRGPNKRRRNEFEGDHEMPDLSEEKENFERIYVTPKRHRKAPFPMPLGLSVDDFDALTDPLVDQEDQVSLPPSVPYAGEATNHASGIPDEFGRWTAADDRLLVETVLEKLKLTKREWNDCARRLGKDKDTLGKRWRMLVVEGNVGLRRGGRVRRTDLDIESW